MKFVPDTDETMAADLRDMESRMNPEPNKKQSFAQRKRNFKNKIKFKTRNTLTKARQGAKRFLVNPEVSKLSKHGDPLNRTALLARKNAAKRALIRGAKTFGKGASRFGGILGLALEAGLGGLEFFQKRNIASAESAEARERAAVNKVRKLQRAKKSQRPAPTSASKKLITPRKPKSARNVSENVLVHERGDNQKITDRSKDIVRQLEALQEIGRKTPQRKKSFRFGRANTGATLGDVVGQGSRFV